MRDRLAVHRDLRVSVDRLAASRASATVEPKHGLESAEPHSWCLGQDHSIGYSEKTETPCAAHTAQWSKFRKRRWGARTLAQTVVAGICFRGPAPTFDQN